MSRVRSFVLLWLPVLLWASLIFAFSAQPNLRFAQADAVDFVVRKAGHMFAFGALAVLLWRALASAGVGRAFVWSWMLTAVYAASDEFHQSFTSGRHPSPLDVGIDSVGALIALAAVAGLLRVGWFCWRGPGRQIRRPQTTATATPRRADPGY